MVLFEMNYIPWLVFIIVSSYIFLKASELFLPEKNQESFRQALKGVEEEIYQKGAEWTVLSPIYYMSLFLDKYLGKKLVSRRSIYTASIFATILVIATIWLTNIPANKGDFLQKSPLKLWNQSIEVTGKISSIKNINIGNGTSDELEKQRQARIESEERYAWLLKLNNLGGAYIFTFVLLLSCFVSIVILSSLTLAITRQILREMIDAKGFWTLFGGFTVNVFLALILCSFFYLVLLFISEPAFWTIGGGLILVFIKYILVALPIGAIFAYLILPGWIQLVVLVSIIPIILLAFTLLLSALIFVFRRPIHSTVLHLFRRALEWKAGPISFFAALLGLLAFIIGSVIH